MVTCMFGVVWATLTFGCNVQWDFPALRPYVPQPPAPAASVAVPAQSRPLSAAPSPSLPVSHWKSDRDF
jgi:hypothetical protein